MFRADKVCSLCCRSFSEHFHSSNPPAFRQHSRDSDFLAQPSATNDRPALARRSCRPVLSCSGRTSRDECPPYRNPDYRFCLGLRARCVLRQLPECRDLPITCRHVIGAPQITLSEVRNPFGGERQYPDSGLAIPERKLSLLQPAHCRPLPF